MESRLEEGEDINSADYLSTDVADDWSVPLLPENEEIQSGSEMGQNDQTNYQSQPQHYHAQYFATLAAVLGGMTMGTTIGTIRYSIFDNLDYPSYILLLLDMAQ